MYGAEASGLGLDTDKHAATFAKGRPGILHGALMEVLQDAHGQIMEAFSISAGLDYPGVGPEHCYFNEIGRATYDSITDEEALEGFKLLSSFGGDHSSIGVQSCYRSSAKSRSGNESGPNAHHLPIWSWRQGCHAGERTV